MSDQISHNNPIWDLTPTELMIAYLSLTKTKPEIARIADIELGTVGTHLTNIYAKLGLSEFDDDVKRALLEQRYGEALNAVVKKIDEKYDHYDDKIRAIRTKRSEVSKQKKPSQTAPELGQMKEPPPPPQSAEEQQAELGRDANTNRVWLIVWSLALLVSCVFLLIILPRNPGAGNPDEMTETTMTPTASHTAQPSEIPSFTPTITLTPAPPTSTLTPTLLPPIPLPFNDDFDPDKSELWQIVYGEPFVANGGLGSDDPPSLVMLNGGNLKNYIVEVGFIGGYGVNSSYRDNFIAVRVQSPNDFIAIQWYYNYWSWIIVEKGETKEVPGTRKYAPVPPRLILTVEENRFTATAEYSNGKQLSNQFTYSDVEKFKEGGIGMRIYKWLYVDYVRINSIP